MSEKKIIYKNSHQRKNFPDKFFDGYGYNYYDTSKTTRYIRCFERTSLGCGAHGKIFNSKLILTVDHDHVRNPEIKMYFDFQNVLFSAVTLPPYRNLREIYNHFSATHFEAARKYTWAKMETVMGTWRRNSKPATPPAPQNLHEYENLLREPKYAYLTNYPQGQLSVRTREALDGSSLSILYDLNFVASIPAAGILFMDATFKSTPKQMEIYQLFTILVYVEDKALPVCWMLMTRKTTAIYEEGLRFFKDEIAPHITPQVIMTDFEAGLKVAITNIYPEADHRGCYFHYCQAIMKKLKKLKILDAIRTWKYAQIIIRKFMGLALLPADKIPQAHLWLVSNIPDGIKNSLREFLTYFDDEWIRRTTPELWSVFNLINRTNNFTESYNKKANEQMGKHPSIWTFTEKLTNLQAVTLIEYLSLTDGELITRKRKTAEDAYREAKIRKIWQLYEEGKLDTPSFFACVSNFSNAFRSQHYIEMRNNADHNDNYENLIIFSEVDVYDL